MSNGDVVEIDAEKVGGKLREGGFLTMSMGGGAGEDGDRPGWLDPDGRAFPSSCRDRRRRSERADLGIRGNAASYQPGLFAELALFIAKPLDAGDRQRAVERVRIGAAVIQEPGGGLERKLLRGGHV